MAKVSVTICCSRLGTASLVKTADKLGGGRPGLLELARRASSSTSSSKRRASASRLSGPQVRADQVAAVISVNDQLAGVPKIELLFAPLKQVTKEHGDMDGTTRTVGQTVAADSKQIGNASEQYSDRMQIHADDVVG